MLIMLISHQVWRCVRYIFDLAPISMSVDVCVSPLYFVLSSAFILSCVHHRPPCHTYLVMKKYTMQVTIDVVVDDVPPLGIRATDRIGVRATASSGNPDVLHVRSELVCQIC